MRYDCLIIDDEKELANNTAEYFNMFDVKTAAVYSAAGANVFLSNNEPAVVLLDINLSDGSGFELCKKIRQTLNIPILFISARNNSFIDWFFRRSRNCLSFHNFFAFSMCPSPHMVCTVRGFNPYLLPSL